MKVSPFVIAKRIMNIVAGPVKELKKMFTGSVKTLNNVQLSRLLQVTELAAMKIEVSHHDTLNQLKGIVVSRDLLSCTEVKLFNWHCKVVPCRWLSIKRIARHLHL